MCLLSVCGVKGKRFFSNSVRRVSYEFNGRDRCSLMCLTTLWRREAALQSSKSIKVVCGSFELMLTVSETLAFKIFEYEKVGHTKL